MAKFEETKSESLNQLISVDQLVKSNKPNLVEELNISSDFSKNEPSASLP